MNVAASKIGLKSPGIAAAGMAPIDSAVAMDSFSEPGLGDLARENWTHQRAAMLCLLGAHRSEIMFGVLVVVLCRDCIAILSLSTG